MVVVYLNAAPLAVYLYAGFCSELLCVLKLHDCPLSLYAIAENCPVPVELAELYNAARTW